MLLLQNAMFRLPQVSMLSRPNCSPDFKLLSQSFKLLEVFKLRPHLSCQKFSSCSPDFLRFEAHLTKKFQFYHGSLNLITDVFVCFEVNLSRTLLGVLRRDR